MTAKEVSKSTGKPAVKTGAGVKLRVDDLNTILGIRTFKELLFAIHKKDPSGTGLLLPPDGEKMAKMLKESDMMELIEKNHVEKGPFYFRIGIQTRQHPQEKASLAKEAAAALERSFQGKLINSASHYEMYTQYYGFRPVQTILSPVLSFPVIPYYDIPAGFCQSACLRHAFHN